MSFILSNTNSLVSTNPQDKRSNNSIYLDLSGSRFNGSIKVFVIGIQSNGQQKLCTNRGEYFNVQSNKKYILYNTVFEDGCRSCFLQFSKNDPNDVISGMWEADSSNDGRGELLARGLSLDCDLMGAPDTSNHELACYKKSENVWDSLPLSKSNNSSIYLKMFSCGGNDSCQVQIIGLQNDKEENCTNKSDTFIVSSCNKYMMYNTVYEKGYRNVMLRFFCQNQPQGQWSADSIPESGCITLTGNGFVSGAKNTKDEAFHVDEGNCMTNVRDKGTSTSVYLNLSKSNFGGTVRVSIYGCNGSDECNCTNKCDSFEVSAGKKYMMYNTVNERGYKAAKLVFTNLDGKTVDGVWSPDSAPEGGCIELKGVGGPSGSKNIKDTDFRFDGSGIFVTEMRWKGTDSSVYLNLVDSKFNGSINVSIIGFTDGREENCTNKTDTFSVTAGNKYELYNLVKERGHSNVFLKFVVTDNKTIVGKWSPDYSPESGVIKVTGNEGTSSCSPSHNLSSARVLIKVPYINQLDVAAGCESASATMLLQYYNVSISVHDFIHKHLEVRPWRRENGRQIAAHPDFAFVGDPYKSSGYNCGYGCYAPCIARAMTTVLGYRFQAVSQIGRELKQLVSEHIEKGRPILIWATMNMTNVTNGSSWIIDYPDDKKGQSFQWKGGEHCLVLVGYDNDNYIFNDPYRNNGVCAFPKSRVEKCYNDLGRQSVHVFSLEEIKFDFSTAEKSYEEIQKMALEKENEMLQSLIPGVKLTFDKSYEFTIQGVAKVKVTLKPAVKGTLSKGPSCISIKCGKMKPDLDYKIEHEGNFIKFKKGKNLLDSISGGLQLGDKWFNLSVDMKIPEKKLGEIISKLTLSINDGMLKFSYDFIKNAYVVSIEQKLPTGDLKWIATVELEISLTKKPPNSPKLPPSEAAAVALTALGFCALVAVGAACVAAGPIGVGAAAGAAAGSGTAGTVGGTVIAVNFAKDVGAAAASIALICGNLFSGRDPFQQ